ncbi:MAG: cysteine synthase A [Clostridia bacterium]|nr:cysteine synthase A [Clostridia bacterium]
MKIYENVTELIGRTPLMRLNNIEKAEGLDCVLLAKLECMNPAGSAKDRVAKSMIEDAEKRGLLKAGATIIEPTSGNTGIGLASLAASMGYRAIFTMPDTMSAERQMLLRAYGAEIVLTPGSEGMAGAIRKAEELRDEIAGSFIPGQFENPANPAAHEATTGPEIWEDTDGKIDVFVCGIGTGGTVSGTGRYLKKMNPAIRVIGIEPSDSPVLSGGKAGAHPLQGIGAGFIPKALDTEIYDEIITVTGDEAYSMGRAVARKEGILVGITSGAAVHAAVSLAKRPEYRGKTIVALLPDSGERYLSTPLFRE